jgi:hypothetical protein
LKVFFATAFFVLIARASSFLVYFPVVYSHHRRGLHGDGGACAAEDKVE